MNRSYRAEAMVSFYQQEENIDELFYGTDLPYGNFFNGPAAPVHIAFTGETTRFGNYGPNTGHTFRLAFRKYIPFSSDFLDAYTVEADLRKYIRIDNNTLFAFRLDARTSGGKNPLIFWTGGNNTVRSAGYYSVTGNHLFFFNAEFRFPLVQVALTPIGLIGPVRGVFFFDIGGAWYDDQSFKVFTGDGIQLQDAIASYGYGVEFFIFGLPIHVEWVYRTDFKDTGDHGVNLWIGFDF